MAYRDPNKIYTYNIFGRNIALSKGFQLSPGVSINQNKKSVEEGFKKLEKWLENPTPENWNKTFGKNNAFGLQLRNYLLNRNDLGSVKGMPTANAVFDKLNVKNLIQPAVIEKINDLTVGGKGVSLKSIAADTKGNLRFSLNEQTETIKNFQNGEQWLSKNRSESEIRKYANAIKGMERESAKIGGFPFGNNSEKKLWAGLYRSSYRGDRIKIVGEFADGNLPIKNGKVDWKITNKAGVPAWKRVQFVDTALEGQPKFTWNNFKGQVDNFFGEGSFNRITEPYDTQVKTGSKRLSSGETIKNKTKVNLLRAELFTQEPGRFKVSQVPTEAEYNKYVNSKSRGFNITEVHHPDGIGKNPWKMEPVFRYANREIDKVSQKINAGTISLDDAKLEIERVNRDVGPIRMKLDDGYFGTKTTTQKATLGAAESYLNTFIKNVKGTKGACRALLASALGGPIDTCETVIRQDPEAAAKKINQIPEQSGPINKVKNAASTFLNVAKKGGRFGAFAAVGAAGAGLVKEFRNDDPSTYLSSENQQKNMLIDMLEKPVVTPTEEPSTALGDATLPAIGAVTAAGMIPGGAELYRQRTGAGSRKRPLGGDRLDAEGVKIPKKRVSPFRAATGPLSGVLGKGLAATGTPLGMLALEPLYIGQQIAEGDSFGEIATNPINYLGPAFAGSLSKEATRFAGPKMANLMRLGISPTTLKTVSRRFGLPGLALSAGVSGYEMYQNKKAGRGLFDDG